MNIRKMLIGMALLCMLGTTGLAQVVGRGAVSHSPVRVTESSGGFGGFGGGSSGGGGASGSW